MLLPGMMVVDVMDVVTQGSVPDRVSVAQLVLTTTVVEVVGGVVVTESVDVISRVCVTT